MCMNFSFRFVKIYNKKLKTKKLFNCYGSTELSPWVFYHECKINDKKFSKYNLVPIGKNIVSPKHSSGIMNYSSQGKCCLTDI